MKRVLIVAPHADDEVLGAGGAIQHHICNDDDVFVIIVGQRTVSDQHTQALDALNIFGYQNELEWLGFPDENMHTNLLPIIKEFDRINNKIKPNIVYTCHPGDYNIDHQTVYKASTIMTRVHQKNKPSTVLSYEIPSSTDQGRDVDFVPNYYIPMTQHHVDKKIAALEMYTAEVREYPHPRSSHGLRVYAQKRGMECGQEFAEAYKLIHHVL